MLQGGKLKVSFDEENGAYKNVWLVGPAKFVFKGTYMITLRRKKYLPLRALEPEDLEFVHAVENDESYLGSKQYPNTFFKIL